MGARLQKMEMAIKSCSGYRLNDSGGARVRECVITLGAYADIFLRNTLASGVYLNFQF